MGLVDGHHHARRLDDGVGLFADGQAQALGRTLGDDVHDLHAGGDLDDHLDVDRAGGNGDDAACVNVAGS